MTSSNNALPQASEQEKLVLLNQVIRGARITAEGQIVGIDKKSKSEPMVSGKKEAVGAIGIWENEALKEYIKTFLKAAHQSENFDFLEQLREAADIIGKNPDNRQMEHDLLQKIVNNFVVDEQLNLSAENRNNLKAKIDSLTLADFAAPAREIMGLLGDQLKPKAVEKEFQNFFAKEVKLSDVPAKELGSQEQKKLSASASGIFSKFISHVLGKAREEEKQESFAKVQMILPDKLEHVTHKQVQELFDVYRSLYGTDSKLNKKRIASMPTMQGSESPTAQLVQLLVNNMISVSSSAIVKRQDYGVFHRAVLGKLPQLAPLIQEKIADKVSHEKIFKGVIGFDEQAKRQIDDLFLGDSMERISKSPK